MMDPHDMDRPDPVYHGLYTGVVQDVNDPENVGRVRIRIPGLIEPASNWAFPLATLGGGQANRGFFSVPDPGAEVAVLFLQGDVDHPYYFSGAWGRNEVPEPARTAGADVNKVKVLETETYRITIDDRSASRTLTLADKSSGDVIQMNGLTRNITIKATTGITIESVGQVQIQGAAVLINGIPAGTGRL